MDERAGSGEAVDFQALRAVRDLHVRRVGLPGHHPDQVILTPRAAHVGIGNARNGRVMRNVVICALVHITRVGPMPKTPRKRRK